MSNSVYVVLTPTKVHAYGSHSRQQKVLDRGHRMFPEAKWEATQARVRKGDPYKSVETPDWTTRLLWGHPCCMAEATDG